MSSKLDRSSARKASLTVLAIATAALAVHEWPVLWTIAKVVAGCAAAWYIFYLMFLNEMFGEEK